MPAFVRSGSHGEPDKIEHSPFGPFVHRVFPRLLHFVPDWVSPNAISLFGIALALGTGAALLLAGHSRYFYLLGAALLLGTWLTDTLDGELARARGATSKTGYYLDHFGDSIAGAAVSLGMFGAAGSHLQIGLACCAILLLLHVNGHVKAVAAGAMELPAFGPTELRLLTIALLVGQAFLDYGQPFSLLPEWLGTGGLITNALGFDRGLTFLDTAGLVAIAVFAGVMLPLEFAATLQKLRRIDETYRAAR
jgi:phosphatidylglycerophosphate synthase